MKWILLLTLFYLLPSDSIEFQNSNTITELAPCPNSPNCVSTQEKRKRKRMRPIKMNNSKRYAIRKMKTILSRDKFKRVKLIEEGDNFLRYEFTTKVGKFIDDVVFLFDEKNKEIHFRSASRKGYGDFGKNKRRMKKVRKVYEETFVTFGIFEIDKKGAIHFN